MYFHYVTCHTLAQKPLSRVIWNLQIWKTLPWSSLHVLSLSESCPRVEKISEETMHFHYMTNMTTSYFKNPCPGGHQIYNFGRLFLGHHYYISSIRGLDTGVTWVHFFKVKGEMGWEWPLGWNVYVVRR